MRKGNDWRCLWTGDYMLDEIELGVRAALEHQLNEWLPVQQLRKMRQVADELTREGQRIGLEY